MKLKNAKKLCNAWIYRLGLRWWDYEICFITDEAEAYKTFGYDQDSVVVGRTYADWRYGTFTIYFNFPAMKHKTAYEVEKIVIHELCHVLVNEMREEGVDHEERVVSGLTKAFLWTQSDCLEGDNSG